jgi:hypothetical protein
MGPEAHHGFQGVRNEAEDVFSKRREDLEMAPQPLGCKKREEAEWGKEKGKPRGCRWHRINRGPGLLPLIALTGTSLNCGIAVASLRLEVKRTP